MKHKLERVPKGSYGSYRYRGILITKNEAERGYWGYWRAVSCRAPVKAATLAQLCREIDEKLDQSDKRQA